MSASAELSPDVMTDDGTIATDRLAKVLHITEAQLANATGLSRDAVSKHDQLSSGQRRPGCVVPARSSTGRQWTGSVGHAFTWYRTQPLPSFGDQTAEDLVKEGRAQGVKDYLSRIAEGGFA